MLIDFKFSNFLSFEGETYFSMAATPIKELSESLINVNKVPILPIAGVYGANASGKTNFFTAFGTMRQLVLNRKNKRNTIVDNEKVLTTPFLFKGDPNNIDELLEIPTMFEVKIAMKDHAYRYGFSCTQKQFISEWLFKQKISTGKTVENLIYEVGFNSEKKSIKFGKINMESRKEIEYCFSMMSDENLLLFDFGQRKKNAELASVYNWFEKSQVLSTEDQEFLCSTANEDIVCSIIDIDSKEQIRAEKDGNLIGRRSLKEKMLLNLREVDPSISDFIPDEVSMGEKKKYRIKTIHNVDGQNYPLLFQRESDGTKKNFVLYLLMLFALEQGRVFFIDELDAKLHPLLLRRILKIFRNKEINTRGAQLVFSAHNIINLNSSDMRRDEIWFVEKKNQRSEMYSLYDFEDDGKVRNDLDYGKHYLSGRFGAVPFQE